MIVLVKATVLAVGLKGKNKILRQLPIRVVNMRTGLEASRSLKNEKFDSIISNWEAKTIILLCLELTSENTLRYTGPLSGQTGLQPVLHLAITD